MQNDNQKVTWREQVTFGAQQVSTACDGLFKDLLADAQHRGVEIKGQANDLYNWWTKPLSLDQRGQDIQKFSRETAKKNLRQWRLYSERGADQGRRVTAYLRLRGLVNWGNVKQTYAAFYLTMYEAEAGQILARIDPQRRRHLESLAEQIQQAQLRMGQRLLPYNHCAQCKRPSGPELGGECCSSSVAQVFKPMDGVFRRLLRQRAPVWPKLPKDHTRCGYMGPTGCRLPAGSRPLVCVSYFCEELREQLDRDGVWAQMSADFEQIREAMKALYFRYQLDKRSILKSHQTMVDATMGYLWSKILSLYTFSDVISPPKYGPEGKPDDE